MERRNVEDILIDSLPNNSKDLYMKRWNAFMEFIGEQRKPSEQDYIQYSESLFILRRSYPESAFLLTLIFLVC